MMMNAFMLALREIRNNLLRAGLTTLGIVIGVAAVIAMVTLGTGATQSVTSTISSMGRNLLFVTPGLRRGPPSAATNFDEADADAILREVPGLAALADSIKVRGVLQPVLVRPLPGGTYELIAGERRWRAAQLAELELLPAVVRHHEDAASLETALIENMVREDLNPIEEAKACAALTEELGLSR